MFPTQRCYIVAELSANHNNSITTAEALVRAAAAAGADAIKLQTYTAETITIDCTNELFYAKGEQWSHRTLFNLFTEAHMPWEWQPRLKELADSFGIDLFSTPFDPTAVDFLETMNVPCYKVASFEIVDIPLLKKIAATGKPVIMSTGMASLAEIDEAVCTLRAHGTKELVLLQCTSAYPAPPEEANLLTIPHMAQTFNCPAGLSDHTLGSAVAVAAVALGASVIEKHLVLTRDAQGVDAAFSMEPQEFTQFVHDIRMAEKALGHVCYQRTASEEKRTVMRRSLFVVEDVSRGEVFTEKNVRSIRPGYGLHTRYLDIVLGKTAQADIKRGTPLRWEFL